MEYQTQVFVERYLDLGDILRIVKNKAMERLNISHILFDLKPAKAWLQSLYSGILVTST